MEREEPGIPEEYRGSRKERKGATAKGIICASVSGGPGNKRCTKQEGSWTHRAFWGLFLLLWLLSKSGGRGGVHVANQFSIVRNERYWDHYGLITHFSAFVPCFNWSRSMKSKEVWLSKVLSVPADLPLRQEYQMGKPRTMQVPGICASSAC